MKIIVTISMLVGVAVFVACTNRNRLMPVPSLDQICPEDELCETVIPKDPSLIRTPVPGSRYYHVSPRGDDKNPGTNALPFQTISQAANVAEAGSVVLVHAGIYKEDVRPLHSGEPDKYITYQNAGDGEVIIDAQNGQRAGCIEIDNKSYLQFIGLTVRGANSFLTWPRSGISMTDGTHHIILDDITTYNNYFGIMAYGRENPVRYIIVKNSKTFGPGNMGNTHYGIFFYKKVYDSSIINNHVAYALPEVQSYGIEISTDYPGLQAEGPRRIIITGNEVDHNESQGIHIWNGVGIVVNDNYLHDNGATGIQIEDGSEDIVVEKNLSENNAQTYEFETGIWVDDAKNVLVRNNILRKNEIGLTITGSDRVIVHDNYIYSNNRETEYTNNAAGLIVADSSTNVAVVQNVFYKNGSSTSQVGDVNFGVFHPSCSSITFKNNIVADTVDFLDLFQDSCSSFVSDFNNFFNIRPLAIMWNQNQMDWPAYQTTSGQDAHSLTENPKFVDPTRFDFSLQTGSPLIDRGTILTQTSDAGSGDTFTVTDSSYFSDGFGIGAGDSIVIAGHRVKILSIDYIHHSIKIDHVIKWEAQDPVSFPFTGIAPDIGVSELP